MRNGIRIAALLGGAILTSHPIMAQSDNAPVAAQGMVVSLTAYPDSARTLTPSLGAGIIVGYNTDQVFIVTAEHVASFAVGGRLDASFAFAPADTVAAEIFRLHETLDIAVVTVAMADVTGDDLPSLDRLGPVESIGRGDPVRPMGCPEGECWESPPDADRVLRNDGEEIAFLTDLVRRGSSGGALFDQYWDVVGMVVTQDPGRGQAMPFDLVIAVLNQWRVPVAIRTPSIPRKWYDFTIGGAYFTPSPTGRPPSGRFTIEGPLSGNFNWHLSGTRLAPDDIAITAAAFGVGYRLSSGRVSVRPFVELGFGRAVTRVDIGGVRNSLNELLPLYQSTEDGAVGSGGGITLGIILTPGVILEPSFGFWRFVLPFPSTQELPPNPVFPDMNTPFFGIGLRWGIA